MNFFNRAVTSVKRRPVKSITFLILIFLLGVLISGAITVRQAINHTDTNLRRRMPTIMMVEYDETVCMETGEWIVQDISLLTPEMIREIAELSYVQFFDYAIDVGHWSVTSTYLEPWTREDLPFPIMGNYWVGLGAYIRPRGVSSPEFIEVRDGLIDLIDGRTFTEEELTNRPEVTPVIISAELAYVNNLSVGSTFDSRLAIWDTTGDGSLDGTISHEEQGLSAIVDETFPMKVIGIFEAFVPEIPMDIEIGFPILNQVAAIHHRVYLPNNVAEEMFDLRIIGEVAANWLDEAFDATIIHFFTLADPIYHNDFERAVDQLEGNWNVIDLSSGFREIAASMDNMRDIADFILIGSVGATILIVGLLILLFLRDRKYEIGVYLAMGDKKKNIVKQIVLELIPLSIIGLTLALFVGNIVSGRVSREMIHQDLLSNPPTQESVQMGGSLENLGYRFNFSSEEMLASYEISLDPTIIVMFYGIGLGTVLISTLIPIILAVNVDPMKLLL